MAEIKKDDLTLIIDGTRLDPTCSFAENVGFCVECDGEMKSLAYYKSVDDWLVAAVCEACRRLVLLRYDRSWKWLGDLPLHEIEEIAVVERSKVSSIPNEKLVCVFTPAEIRDMLACEGGRPYVRQNLYRAKAKFDSFKERFGIQIEL